MEENLRNYILSYLSSFMTKEEGKNYNFLQRYTHSSYSLYNEPDGGWIEEHPLNKQVYLQNKRKRVDMIISKYKEEGINVDYLLSIGYFDYGIQVANRIWNDHQHEIELNICPKCNSLARTPKAKQCRFCGYDWH